MDTRTPNRPQGGRGAEDGDGGPGLYTVKVPSDPARLSSTTASFRVRLGTSASPLIDARVAAPAFAASPASSFSPDFTPGPVRPLGLSPDETQPMAAIPDLVGAGAAGGPNGSTAAPRRRARVTPITWTGGAAPLLDAVQQSGQGTAYPDRFADPGTTQQLPLIGAQPGPADLSAGPPGDPRARAAYPGSFSHAYGEEVAYVDGREPWGSGPEFRLDGREPGEPVRHAWYPGRRVDLGLVLLPLRVFLGAISIYAGFVKLCDPVYFDGGARGSMMHWLQQLHPWPMARPLLQFALTHPVGAGLGVAFVQIVVGVLSILGLWQRLAAATAMLLSLALLLTVSWRTVPAYDAPGIIYLAAWSPLLLAGAPFFSLDGRLALEAWHRLGDRAAVSVLRRRVLRRGLVVATMVIGSTLLLGSALGAAVRGTQPIQTVAPATTDQPTGYPSPIFPSGITPVLPVAGRPKASAHPSPSTSPTAPGHHPAPKHSTATHGGSTPTGSGGHSSTSTGGTSSGGSKPTTHRTPTSGGTKTGGTNGVIGGLLGSGPPLPVLGMPGAGAPAPAQPVT